MVFEYNGKNHVYERMIKSIDNMYISSVEILWMIARALDRGTAEEQWEVRSTWIVRSNGLAVSKVLSIRIYNKWVDVMFTTSVI